MTREALVDEFLECAKRHWLSFWSQLPDERRLRLSSMESEIGAIIRYRRERRRDQIEVDVLGHRVTFPCSYLYCRRCRQGVNPVRRWLGVEQGGVSDRTKAERLTYRVGEQAAEYLGPDS